MNLALLIIIIAAHAVGIALAVRRLRRHDRWAPIPTLTDLNGPRLTKRMGDVIAQHRRSEARAARHAKLCAFLRLEGVTRRP